MKKTGKRFISLLLAVCMLLGTVPAFSVNAANGDEPDMTRAQLAVAIYRWFLPEAGNAAAAFNDLSDCTQEEKAAIETLAKAGIVQGTSEGNFLPQQTATRLEAAVAIFRTMNLAESGVEQHIFTDIPTGQEGAFNALVEQGILLSSDATNDKFLPSDSVSSETVSTWLSRAKVSWHFTRAQLAVMVCDVFDLSETGNASFDDIGDLDAETQEAILTLANLGIVTGTADSQGKSFDPDGLVNRMTVAVVLYRLYTHFGYQNVSENQTVFTDDGLYQEGGESTNVLGHAFNLLVARGVLGVSDILYPTNGETGLFMLYAMVNTNTALQWMNAAYMDMHPDAGAHQVTVQVTGGTPDVSYVVNWFQNGEKIGSGASLILSDTTVPLHYEVVLDEEAVKKYRVKNGSGQVALSQTDSATTVTVTLQEYETISVTGTVIDAENTPVRDASITLTQHYSADINETLNAVITGADGTFTIENVKTVSSVVKISAPGYYDLNTTVSFDIDNPDSVDLNSLQLSSLPESKVQMALYFQSAAADENAGAVTAISSFANMVFTVEKDGSPVTDFTAQYPYLVFGEGSGVGPNDILTISVTDESGKAAMKENAAVMLSDTGSGDASITMVERGKLSIDVLTGAAQATVMLFDSTGKLAASGAAWGSYTSPSLPDGTYTLVALEKTALLQSVSTLSQLHTLGLSVDEDYVQQSVQIKTGVVTTILSLEVPELDETSIAYTESADTSVDYSTVSVGKNVTLRIAYQLKETVASNTVSVEITLPAGLRFNGAPTLDGKVQTVTSGSQTMTIPVNKSSGVVRVYVQGNTAGKYDITPTLLVGNAVQPVGTAHVEVTQAQMYVPSETGRKEVPISGIALADGKVTVYVDGEPVGVSADKTSTAVADHTGLWSADITLDDAGYTQHQVYAKIEKDGETVTTETKTLIYDPDYIDVSKVTMYNLVDDREQEVVFDYTNPYKGNNYFTVIEEEFTFVITFDGDNSDCDRLTNVRLNLFTQSGDVYTESAQRIEGTNQYTAVVSDIIPVNVGVEYLCRPVIPVESVSPSSEMVEEMKAAMDQTLGELSNYLEVKSMQEWNDAFALTVGVKDDEDGDFDILVHALEYKDTTETDLKEQNFAAVNMDALGIPSADPLYYRLTITESWIQHVVVGFDGTNTSCKGIAISIPVDFQDIQSWMDTYIDESVEEITGEDITLEQLREKIDSSFGQSSDELAVQNLATLNWQNAKSEGDAGIIEPFPYSRIEMKKADSNFFTTLMTILEGGIVSFPLISPYVGTIDLQMMEGRLRERGEEVGEEIRYASCTILQLESGKDCTGQPLATEQELARLKQMRDSLLTNRLYLSQYWNAQLRVYKQKLVNNAIMETLTMGILKLTGKALEKYAEASPVLKQFLGNLLDPINEFLLQLDIRKIDELLTIADIPEEMVGLITFWMDIINWLKEGAEDAAAGTEGEVEGFSIPIQSDFWNFTDISGAPYHAGIADDYDNVMLEAGVLRSEINRIIGNARKKCPPEPFPNNEEDPEKSPCLDKIYGIDPSGYVYEAVPSNRLEGVTAEIYKLENSEYKLWEEADKYGGQTPRVETDEQGAYRWDVPEGTWKVTFSKAGYADKTVEGLDVPPPRTDVNVGLVSTAAPSVESVQAYTDSVLIEFSQYMDIESVKEAITLTLDGQSLTCTVEPLNEETDTNLESKPTYASRFEVIPEEGKILSGSVSVSVAETAKNYNGLQIPSGNKQEVEVTGEKLTGITAPETLGILQGDIAELRLTLQPQLADEALQVEIITPSLVQFTDESTAEVTTGNDGIATVLLKGLLPGKGMVKITHVPTGLTKTVNISVVTQADQLSKPGNVTAKSNGKTLSDNDTVTAGAVVTLTESSNAEIYYTLDGTCPKADGALQYTGPITIAESTTLRAVAVSRNGVFGEVSTWNLAVSGGGTGGGPVGGGGENPDEGEETPSLPFTDLDENAWYYPAVQYVFEHEMMLGTSDTAFSPSGKLSRAMVAQILYNLEGRPAVEGTGDFTDVQEGVWWTPAIAWAKENGIVNGYEDNTFQPKKNVTRQEFAKMMYNYAAYKGYDLTAEGDLTEYADGGSVSGWAMESMAWANGNQLINGFEDQTLRPLGTATRVQAAQILMNFRENMAA